MTPLPLRPAAIIRLKRVRECRGHRFALARFLPLDRLDGPQHPLATLGTRAPLHFLAAATVLNSGFGRGRVNYFQGAPVVLVQDTLGQSSVCNTIVSLCACRTSARREIWRCRSQNSTDVWTTALPPIAEVDWSGLRP